jgi:hypothetical protein
MKRYEEEKQLIKTRIKQYKLIGGYAGPQHDQFVPSAGHFRKTLRCMGCGRSRCQLCHSDKYPKRKPTRQEQENWQERDD